MVKPGVNQVERMPRDCRNARMRGDARAPNSPRDRAVGVVRPRAMKPDMVSKSKVRQTIWRGTALKFLLENNLAVVLSPNLGPAVLAIESFGARASLGRQRRNCVTAVAKDLTGHRQQGASDSTPLVRGVHEEREDLSIPRVRRGKALDGAVFFPRPKCGVVENPIGDPFNRFVF